MALYELIMQNREFFRLLYTFIIGLVCVIIVLKTNKLFKLSFHQGIRYFRNAFLFYGLAFIMRYFLGAFYVFDGGQVQSVVMNFVFEFFLIMAGFFLLSSLLWRKFESKDKSSLFNSKILLFYCLTLVIVFLDRLWGTYLFMFISQIILFSYAAIISYVKSKDKKVGSFLRLYLTVILLNLIAWIINFVVATFFNWHRGGVVGIYLLNIIIFLLFLYGVISVTRKN